MAVEDILDDWEPIEYDYLTKLYDIEASADYDTILDAMAALERKQAAFRGFDNGAMTYGPLASCGFEMPPGVTDNWPLITRRITSVVTQNRAWGGLNGSPQIHGFTGGYTEHHLKVQIDIMLGVNVLAVQQADWARTNWVRLYQQLYAKNDTLGGRCNAVTIDGEHQLGRAIIFAGKQYYGHSLKAQIWATYPLTGAPTPEDE